MRVLCATVTEATVHAIAAEYHHSTLIGTPVYRSHSSTALYESYIAAQEESGCVEILHRIARIQPIQVGIDMVGIFFSGKLSFEGLTIMQHCTAHEGTPAEMKCKYYDIKVQLHPKPNLSMFCVLFQNYHHFKKKMIFAS